MTRGRIAIALAALLWSVGGVAIRVLTGDFGVAPEAFTCLRSASAGLVLAWALPGLRGTLRPKVPAAGAFYLLLVLTFVRSTVQTSAANAILLQYFYPVLAALGALLFYGERIVPRGWLALALATAGVVTIAAGSWTPEDRAGVAFGLVSAVAFAGFVLIQRGMPAGNPIALSSLYNLAAAAVLLPFVYSDLDVGAPALALIALVGVVQLGLPYVLFLWGLKTVRAADAALLTLVEPIANPVWVWLVLGEAPGAATFAGGAAILVALAVRFAGSRE